MVQKGSAKLRSVLVKSLHEGWDDVDPISLWCLLVCQICAHGTPDLLGWYRETIHTANTNAKG